MHSLIREYYKREKLNERRGICELRAVGRSFQQMHTSKCCIILWLSFIALTSSRFEFFSQINFFYFAFLYSN